MSSLQQRWSSELSRETVCSGLCSLWWPLLHFTHTLWGPIPSSLCTSFCGDEICDDFPDGSSYDLSYKAITMKTMRTRFVDTDRINAIYLHNSQFEHIFLRINTQHGFKSCWSNITILIPSLYTFRFSASLFNESVQMSTFIVFWSLSISTRNGSFCSSSSLFSWSSICASILPDMLENNNYIVSQRENESSPLFLDKWKKYNCIFKNPYLELRNVYKHYSVT